ncbi:MAG: hypothetical protein ACPGWR_28975 [Ardenticatenaceae bacterium]
MKGQRYFISKTITSEGWGEVAASRLGAGWEGYVWGVDAESVLLVDSEDGVIRLVTPEIGDGAFHVVVEQGSATLWGALTMIKRGLYASCDGDQLRLGDELTVRLPHSAPWESGLSWWRENCPIAGPAIGRDLAILSDWLMARAPEESLGGLLPDLLAPGDTADKAAKRLDLSREVRLYRWRAGRILDTLWPALASGDIAVAEAAIHRLTGLDTRSPSSGDCFMLGVIAGTQLWSEFLIEGSGLRAKSLLVRLTRTFSEHTGPLGRALLLNALENRWDIRWHTLYAALTPSAKARQPRSHPHHSHNQLLSVAGAWLAQDKVAASAALAGLVMPFLWYQRFLLNHSSPWARDR